MNCAKLQASIQIPCQTQLVSHLASTHPPIQDLTGPIPLMEEV